MFWWLSLLMVLALRWGLGLEHSDPTVLPGSGEIHTELGVFHPSTHLPRASQGWSASLKSGSPDGFSGDLLDLLLLQVAQAFTSDFLEQGPGQRAPQGQVPAEQLLHLRGTGQGREMLLVRMGVLPTPKNSTAPSP